MDLGLKDKVAVISGASKGIGLACAQQLVEEGALVVAGSRTETAELQALVATGRCTFVPSDFRTTGAPGALVQAAIDGHGGVDLLVNNVGGGDLRFNGFLETPDSEWLKVWDFNVMTTVRACRVAIPSMVERGGGSIVNISSINAMLPQSFVVDYSAAKAALKNLGKDLSEEFGPQGVRVNTVSPGATSTPLWMEPANGAAIRYGRAIGKTADEVVEMVASTFALRRFSTADEVAAVVTLLLSPRAGSTTGADVVVDAGTLKQM